MNCRRVVFVAIATFLLSRPVASLTALQTVSEPGDYIGGGSCFTITNPVLPAYITGTALGMYSVTINIDDGTNTQWTAVFSTGSTNVVRFRVHIRASSFLSLKYKFLHLHLKNNCGNIRATGAGRDGINQSRYKCSGIQCKGKYPQLIRKMGDFGHKIRRTVSIYLILNRDL